MKTVTGTAAFGLLMTTAFVASCAAQAPTGGSPASGTITLTESVDSSWAEDNLHRTIKPARGEMFADRVSLRPQTEPARAVAMQLANVQKYPDGSIQQADVWFRSDLPAAATRTFQIQTLDKPATDAKPDTDLTLQRNGNVWEIGNSLTAVRIPAGEWKAPAENGGNPAEAVAKELGLPAATGSSVPGPLLGVKLASGQWTAASSLEPGGADAGLLSYSSKIVESGPIFIRARVTYTFPKGGTYDFDVEVRKLDPFVRVNEKYEKAGMLSIDLGTGLEPKEFATKKNYSGAMQQTAIDYEHPTNLPSLVGWDLYTPDNTAVLGLLGGPRDDLLAWVSTSADWLPDPYNQYINVAPAPGGKLTARASLVRGHRHWGLLVAKHAQFPDAATDLYRWFAKNIAVPLDKVANWQLVWPGMDAIEFPHTFFGKADLPTIRAQLQADPTIKEYMEALRDRNAYWGAMPSILRDSPAQEKDNFAKYKAKYEERKGIVKGISYIGAAALYFNDPVYLEQLNDPLDIDYEMTPGRYLDKFVKYYTHGLGTMTPESRMFGMQVSDSLLQRYVGMELLLGSGLLTPQEKKKFLSKLAFATYVMHEPEWQPPIHMPDGSVPTGYAQGTPNQKHCDFSARAINACMLGNHPMKQEWMKFAMGEVRAHYPSTINESGALLESPFYTSRDTMRYAPFWSAMSRAGVAEVAPDYKQWMNRPKKAFAYLANMLTPKEPRMGGKRVYHPIGRSGPGVVDPTFMIGGDPWGLDDPAHASLMRWAWEQQGRPSPDVMGTTGGRDLSLTLIAFSRTTNAAPLGKNPLNSKRFRGMGGLLRSNSETDYESNALWRHDGFAWDLYSVNNGAIYFYGKGAPLLPRFGAYWSHSYGGAWMMDLPFGNRLEFASGNNNGSGQTTEFSSLGSLADLVSGETNEKDWRRRVLFSKDLHREDPVYLLVRDDVSRPDTASSVNWWFMTKNVAPDGLEKPGVVPIQISQQDWVKNMGHNWKDAPKLTGQLHHFPGMTGVDVDLFIASPTDPQILTDAASAGRFPYNAGPKDMFETQELVRISQPAGKSYLTLLVPRWPGSASPKYATIANGDGVAIDSESGQDRLFLAEKSIAFADGIVNFKGRAGFVRQGKQSLRLMVQDGRIAAGGVTLTTTGTQAALMLSAKKIKVLTDGDPKKVAVALSPTLKGTKVTVERVPAQP